MSLVGHLVSAACVILICSSEAGGLCHRNGRYLVSPLPQHVCIPPLARLGAVPGGGGGSLPSHPTGHLEESRQCLLLMMRSGLSACV